MAWTAASAPPRIPTPTCPRGRKCLSAFSRIAAQVARDTSLRAPAALGRRIGGDAGSYRALFSSGVAEDLGRGDWPEVERKVMDHFGNGDAVREVLRGLGSEER